jgi:LCP family protein required for cell wall assembly
MNFKKYVLLVIFIVGAFLAIAGGFVAANIKLSNNGEGNDNASIIDKLNIFQTAKKMNVLVMGTDGGNTRTDTMVLICVNPREKEVKMLSIPRDTRVRINNSFEKINAATVRGGAELAVQKVMEVTGIPIHNYVMVDLKGFRSVIDILDGLDFDVPQRMYYVDPYQDLRIDLQKGPQHLDGKKAEQLVRYRSYPDGDLGRVRVQQEFLKELANQKLKLEYLSKADDIIKEVFKNIDTDIGLAEALKAVRIFKALQSGEFSAFQLPGTTKTISGLSYFIYDGEEITKLVSEEFGY